MFSIKLGSTKQKKENIFFYEVKFDWLHIKCGRKTSLQNAEKNAFFKLMKSLATEKYFQLKLFDNKDKCIFELTVHNVFFSFLKT